MCVQSTSRRATVGKSLFERLTQTNIGFERQVGGTTIQFRGLRPSLARLTVSLSVLLGRGIGNRKQTRARLKNETDQVVLTRRRAPFAVSGGPSGPRAPSAPTCLAPHPAPVSWRSPGRSMRSTPLRPSWPRLLSPHKWTVPSFSSSSSSSEWHSLLAACRSLARLALVCSRRSRPRGRAPQQNYIPLLQPAVCPGLSAPPQLAPLQD